MSGVSWSWNHQVNSKYLFSVIVKSIKEVNNDLQEKPKQKKMTLEEAKTVEYTSSR